MRLMKPGVVVVVLIALAKSAQADCTQDADELRTALTVEGHKAERWNTTWAWIYTGAAVVTATIGVVDPVHRLQAGMYVSAGKAAIAGAGRFVLPLEARIPDPTGDACADLALLHRELARLGKKERGAFWTNHLGGILLNVAGGYIVYHYSGTGEAALSVGGGMAVGLVSTYTMPRDGWHMWRDTTLVVQPNGVAFAGTV
jgi:hypothetical protein